MHLQQYGITLLEGIITLMVALAAMVWIVHWVEWRTQQLAYEETARQLHQLHQCAKAYLSTHWRAMHPFPDKPQELDVQEIWRYACMGKISTPSFDKEQRIIPKIHLYQQHYRIFVILCRMGSKEQLQLWIATYGGRPIPPRAGRQIVARLKGQGGYIGAVDHTSRMSLAPPDNPPFPWPDSGHLFTMHIVDPSPLEVISAYDFLYRRPFAPYPDLQQMHTDLKMGEYGIQLQGSTTACHGRLTSTELSWEHKESRVTIDPEPTIKLEQGTQELVITPQGVTLSEYSPLSQHYDWEDCHYRREMKPDLYSWWKERREKVEATTVGRRQGMRFRLRYGLQKVRQKVKKRFIPLWKSLLNWHHRVAPQDSPRSYGEEQEPIPYQRITGLQVAWGQVPCHIVPLQRMQSPRKSKDNITPRAWYLKSIEHAIEETAQRICSQRLDTGAAQEQPELSHQLGRLGMVYHPLQIYPQLFICGKNAQADRLEAYPYPINLSQPPAYKIHFPKDFNQLRGKEAEELYCFLLEATIRVMVGAKSTMERWRDMDVCCYWDFMKDNPYEKLYRRLANAFHKGRDQQVWIDFLDLQRTYPLSKLQELQEPFAFAEVSSLKVWKKNSKGGKEVKKHAEQIYDKKFFYMQRSMIIREILVQLVKERYPCSQVVQIVVMGEPHTQGVKCEAE